MVNAFAVSPPAAGSASLRRAFTIMPPVSCRAADLVLIALASGFGPMLCTLCRTRSLALLPASGGDGDGAQRMAWHAGFTKASSIGRRCAGTLHGPPKRLKRRTLARPVPASGDQCMLGRRRTGPVFDCLSWREFRWLPSGSAVHHTTPHASLMHVCQPSSHRKVSKK